MNRIVSSLVLSSLLVSSLGHAGGMGDTGAGCAPSFFASLEGGYVASSITGLSLSGLGLTLTPKKTQDNYSGRIAAGLIRMMDDDFGVTAELGWGYYGSTTFSGASDLTTRSLSISEKYSLTGFDALIGGTYLQPNYTLSLKIGGMIQNMLENRKTSAFNLSPILPSLSTAIVRYNGKENRTQVLPELKLGAGYNFDANWSIIGSYLFVYGPGSKSTYNITDDSSLLATAEVNHQNAMLNSIMIGVQYTV